MTDYQPAKMRTAADHDRFTVALVPVDQAFMQSEMRWGVGRLERLISSTTLAAYRRGWDAYRVALEEGDGEALEQIGPKMIAALAYMDAEASAAGHAPLALDTWETGMPDGTVLVLVRTNAEAVAMMRDAMKPANGGATNEASYVSAETTIPPDLAVTIRHQHEGRALTVVTMAEIARLVTRLGSAVTGDRGATLTAATSGPGTSGGTTPSGGTAASGQGASGQGALQIGQAWEGTAAPSGVQRDEGAAADYARQGYPMPGPLAF